MHMNREADVLAHAREDVNSIR